MNSEFKIPGLNTIFYQNSNSQSISTDTYLLYKKTKNIVETHIVETLNSVSKSKVSKLNILDLGTGCGILLLMLAKDYPEYFYTGVDIIPELTALASQNFALLENELNKKIIYKFLTADYKDLNGIIDENEKFDVIVSNPPYYKADSGKKSSVIEKNIARFEQTCSLHQLFYTIKKYLKEDGIATIIYPIQRNEEVLLAVKENKLNILSTTFTTAEEISIKTKIIYEITNA